MLTEQQIETIDYLVLGTLTNKEIADKVGISDRVIYKWKKNDEFMENLNKRSHDFQTGIIEEAHGILVSKLGQSIKNVIDIANDKNESSKVRLDANFYIINRILGNTTTKIEQSINGNEDKEGNINIDDMINQLDATDTDEFIEGNIIELDKKKAK